MTLDAIIFAHFTLLFVVGVYWIIGRIHRFEQEIAWSHRKEQNKAN